MISFKSISVVIPIHDMKNGEFFLWRAINSILKQSFQDYEIVITKEGSMPQNSNTGIKRATASFVKILYMDDWLEDADYLKKVYTKFLDPDAEWLITAATTNPSPHWTDDIETGNNKLGSPSALTFRNYYSQNLFFDEKLSWLLDCDLYKRMHEQYGEPIILKDAVVGIGIHEGQATHLMSDDYKLSEHEYVQKKYEKSSTNRS